MAKIILLLVLMTGCATVPRSKPSLVLTDSSYGPVVFGQDLTKVEEAVNERPYIIQDEGNCKMVGFMKIPQVQFMIENGIVTRADSVAGSKVVTGNGVRLGSSAEQAIKRIPDLKISKHKYIEDAHYMTELSRDGKRAVIFEDVEGKIDTIRAGLMPSVGYVERCL